MGDIAINNNKRRRSPSLPTVITPLLLLFLALSAFDSSVQAVELSDKMSMVQSESQEQKNKGKFIDDWDEVKQEYKSDEA